MRLQCGNKELDLNRLQVMGILNVTPDSFSDGGRYTDLSSALKQAEKMLQEGASVLDVGGESTRPGAAQVKPSQELDRVIPVVEAIKANFDTIVSVDTSTPEVMEEAASLGANLINDVRALQREGAVESAKRTGLPVCLMHMQGQPKTMQKKPEYQNVTASVQAFLMDRKQACLNAGISEDKLVFDPGFGFGKTLEHNFELLNNLNELVQMGPLLVGVSRKSMIGNLLNRNTDDRLAGSISAAVIAAYKGAKIFRVHDVKETVDALKVLEKTLES